VWEPNPPDTAGSSHVGAASNLSCARNEPLMTHGRSTIVDEWVIVALVGLAVFGAAKLPEIARNLGRAQAEFRRALHADDDDATT
jgi:TatA/E family protein of Tat protein translocase